MTGYKAFLFDLNGTMIDDMDYHITAWHEILNGLGATISWDETKLQCYGKNHELLERVFPGRFSEEEKDEMSLEKERKYQNGFAPHLRLLPGLDQFLEQAKNAGIKMAIGSAAIMFNVNFVLDGLNLRSYFDAIVSADDVAKSKPDPETFTKCAERLGIPAGQCVVFEDSPKGTESAARAGMKCVGLTTMHEPHEFDDCNIIQFVPDFRGNLFESLIVK